MPSWLFLHPSCVRPCTHSYCVLFVSMYVCVLARQCGRSVNHVSIFLSLSSFVSGLHSVTHAIHHMHSVLCLYVRRHSFIHSFMHLFIHSLGCFSLCPSFIVSSFPSLQNFSLCRPSTIFPFLFVLESGRFFPSLFTCVAN